MNGAPGMNQEIVRTVRMTKLPQRVLRQAPPRGMCAVLAARPQRVEGPRRSRDHG